MGGHGGGHGRVQKCSAVIMAFPPTLNNLHAAGIDLSIAERQVFGNVRITNYFASVVKMDTPYGVSFVAASDNPTVPPPNKGEPVAVLRLHPNSSLDVAWSWGPDVQVDSLHITRELLRSTMSKINKDPRNVTAMSRFVSNKDVRAFRQWDYFPHFDTAQLQNGSYAKFNALQGHKKTYWASGLNGFELVEWAIRAGEDVVKSHF
jgi:hypothetical protein